jgi:hypothetical protein
MAYSIDFIKKAVTENPDAFLKRIREIIQLHGKRIPLHSCKSQNNMKKTFTYTV